MQILRDEDGARYRLSKKRLTSIDRGCFWVYLSELVTTRVQLWIGKEGPGHYVQVSVRPEFQRIGCRKFSKKAFAVIMKAAGKAAKK